MTTLIGKIVLLTGASRGIGSVVAQAIAAEGATIVGVSRSPAGLENIGAVVQKAGGKWIGIPFDISQIESLPTLMQKVEQAAGSVDILINNAGIEIYRAFQDYSTAELQAVLSTNLLAAIELSRLVLPGMLGRNSGHIVNMASLAAKKGHPYDSVYSASKAGLLMWGDALRQELIGTGVTLSTVCPGYVSHQGMLADTGISAPRLSGTSTPNDVAIAVLKAIRYNQAETIVNQDSFTVGFTKLLLALWQLFPQLGDRMYRSIGVPQLNRKRIQNQQQTASSAANSQLLTNQNHL
ncbi:SDR family NAD(P)-dependent oxidoreductase [Microcoleus sp. FACHB-1515]|uniref:SDR family NAD(P)-dependent oxidoreductase n=1 Tax=Cyanophyceae TaxID=3028117 RepID=UPI0016855A43|nr:SDR family NAD(P)-dependent oxidoreductase [Microcoleus sp. FACHB-1515]MBD2091230.1 SDR family NAD(P)-dependent oxidoreductase [Microcoleus sp. FACHB-1515]